MKKDTKKVKYVEHDDTAPVKPINLGAYWGVIYNPIEVIRGKMFGLGAYAGTKALENGKKLYLFKKENVKK